MLKGGGGGVGGAMQNTRDLRCKRNKGEEPSSKLGLFHWKQTQSTMASIGKLKTRSLTAATEHARGGPRCDLSPLWAAEGPGNLSWCSSCQPWCFATAVYHPGGWDLLKGNHVNLYATTQSKAEGWSWQAWQSQQKVPKAEAIHSLPTERPCGPLLFCFALSLFLLSLFPFPFMSVAKA